MCQSFFCCSLGMLLLGGVYLKSTCLVFSRRLGFSREARTQLRNPMQSHTEIGYNSKVEGDVVVTRVDAAINWFRKNSLWPMPMGLACCAIELMATGASRFDISRFGAEVMRFSPRQSDVMIVAGTVTYKMALAVKPICGRTTIAFHCYCSRQTAQDHVRGSDLGSCRVSRRNYGQGF